MKLTNAFSLNMVEAFPAAITVRELSLEAARELAKAAESAVGHGDTAVVFSNILGVPVSANRATVSLKSGDVALVGQYRGPRLPEGTTVLPEGATIQWLLVQVLVSEGEAEHSI